jgi:pyroglutamyl-peptidase I
LLGLKLQGRRALVVGAGPVGRRKALRLLDAGAVVRLVSPDATPSAQEASWDEARVERRSRPFEPADLDGCALAFACTDDETVNEAVAREARARGVWCVRADEGGELQTLASVARGGLQVGLSTGGDAPSAAKLARQHAELSFGGAWADLAALLTQARGLGSDAQGRARLLEEPLLHWLRLGDADVLAQRLGQHLGAQVTPDEVRAWLGWSAPSSPVVVLTGFGPFPGVPENPSPKVARAAAALLAERDPSLEVYVQELPTCFDEAWATLEPTLEHLWSQGRLAGVVCLGVSGGSLRVEVERVAVNFRRGGAPDAVGRCLEGFGGPILAHGPDALFSRLPVERVVAELQAQGLPVAASGSAGDYLCNEVFYRLMAWSQARGFRGRAGFVHIPHVPQTLPLGLVAQIVAQIARA